MTKVIGLGFPGSLQDEAVICYICKKYDVNVRIIEASFSMSSGWAILEIDGTEEEFKRTFDYLAGKGIKIQQIETKQQ
jgi:hypothetical protein